jgi:ribosome-associated heat shock protein Hsp15
MKARSDCTRFVGIGSVRLNRQATDKPHAKLRVGDVLTLPLPRGSGGEVRVVRVLALAARRGPATEACGLYEEIDAVAEPAHDARVPTSAP